jgi:hypothetical protein
MLIEQRWLLIIIISKTTCMLNIRGALYWMAHMMIDALTLSNGDLWKCRTSECVSVK